MNQRIRYGRYPAGNPVVTGLMAVAGMLAIGVALVFGFFIFVLAASVITALAAIVGIRIWWVGRRLRKFQKSAGTNDGARTNEGGIIEGEFHVVSTHRERDRH